MPNKAKKSRMRIPRKRVRARKILTKRLRRGAEAAIPRASTHEELLISRLSQNPAKVSVRGLEVQDLLYNSGEELRSLAFKAGFNLGIEAYKGSNGSMSSLEHVLEHAGFGKVVYYPFESRSVFYSSRVKARGINLGANIHVFETGIISGYLTAHSKQRVAAEETMCVFNGSKYCRFVAYAGERAGVASTLQFPNILVALQSAILGSGTPSRGSGYYLFAVKPLLEEPVFSEASRFLYLAGKMLSVSKLLPNLEQTVKRTSNFLRIEKSSIKADGKGNVAIRLTFSPETSTSRFVDLSVALISGIVKGMSGRNVSAERSLDSRGVYNVRLQVLGSPGK